MISILMGLAGLALVWFSLSFEWTHLLSTTGLSAERLSHPWVRSELALLRSIATMVAVCLVAFPLLVWRGSRAITELPHRFETLLSAATQSPLFTSLLLAIIVLTKTVLQLGLYLVGYMVYTGDDFGRALKADYWLQHHRFDLGQEGWLALGGSGWLPFADYLLGLALALHRDLFLTPKIVNLVLSGISVIAVYLLGRQLFGTVAGLFTALAFAFQPWHVWLGVSGMTSDLPSVTVIVLIGLFLLRWLETDRPGFLLAAAACVFAGAGFRYENWLFALAFSLVVLLHGGWRWSQRRLPKPSVVVMAGALIIAAAFPVIWMTASYLLLGDPLPALKNPHLAERPPLPRISIPFLFLSSFPFEFALSIGGIALVLSTRRRASLLIYIFFVMAALGLFLALFKAQLLMVGGVSRILLPYIVLLLPFAWVLVAWLWRRPAAWRMHGVVAAVLVALTMGSFDILRACNYPTWYPKDPVYAGWTLRSLQELGDISGTAKIVIESDEDYWGHAAIAAVAQRPERFALWDQSAAGETCGESFHTEACTSALHEGRVDLLVLLSPERASRFRQTFGGRSWIIGRYHILEVKPSSAARPIQGETTGGVYAER